MSEDYRYTVETRTRIDARLADASRIRLAQEVDAEHHGIRQGVANVLRALADRLDPSAPIAAVRPLRKAS